MDHLERVGDNVAVFFQKLIGFMQETGIIFMALLALFGLLLYLVSGKNPIVKRLGLMMSIIFGIFIFVFAYMPILYYYYTGGGQAPVDTQMEDVFDSTHNWMSGLFRVLLIIGAPVAVTVMLIGLLIRGTGANNPMSKRRGLGMILVSPLVVFLLYLIPSILHFL